MGLKTTMKDLYFFNLSLRLFVYVGLAPLTFVTTSKRSNKRKKSMIWSLCQVVPVLICLMTNLTYFAIVIFTSNRSSTVNSIITFLGFGTLILTNIIASFQSYLYKPVYSDIFRRITKITDCFYHHFKKDLNYSKLMRRFFYKILLLIGLPIVTLAVSYGVNLNKLQMKDSLNVIRLLLEVCFSLEMLHPILYVDVVQMFTHHLNAQLQLNSTSYIRPMSLAKVQFEMLKSVKVIHFEIWKLFENLNKYFGWSVLFMFIKLFIELTYNFYQLFVNIQVHTWRSLQYIEIILILISAAANLQLFINSSQHCSSEISKLMETIDRCKSDKYRNKIFYFCQQEVLQQIRDLPINMTAKGFFNIDRKHLSAIASGCCTYIVILIQFYLSSQSLSTPETNSRI